jgi:hypothetical protein
VAPVAPVIPVAVAEDRKDEEGIEVENPVPVVESLSGQEWDSIFYSDAHHLKPQRKEKIHSNAF